MTIINLTPGEHTITWELPGYNTLTAVVNVSDTGTMSCVNHEDVTITGNKISGLLQLTVELVTEVCQWILSKNGWESIATFDIMELVQGYLNVKDIGFTVTTVHIMGIVAYYNNQLSSGNALTGCELT